MTHSHLFSCLLVPVALLLECVFLYDGTCQADGLCIRSWGSRSYLWQSSVHRYKLRTFCHLTVWRRPLCATWISILTRWGFGTAAAMLSFFDLKQVPLHNQDTSRLLLQKSAEMFIRNVRHSASALRIISTSDHRSWRSAVTAGSIRECRASLQTSVV